MEMFNCELKFVIDICHAWLNKEFSHKKSHLDIFSKKRYKEENPLDFSKTKCVICNFNIGVATKNGPRSKEMIYFDFVVQKEHCSLRNIFDPKVISKSEKLKDIESYFEAFETFIKIVALLENVYTPDSGISDTEHDCLLDVFEENEIDCSKELYLDIFECEVKNVFSLKKAKTHQMKIIAYVYEKVMKFPNGEFNCKAFVSKKSFVW